MDNQLTYVLSTLRRADEGSDAALERFWRSGWVDADLIDNPRLRKLLLYVQDNASSDVAVSVQMASSYIGVERDKLRQMADEVDPDGISSYAKLVVEAKEKQHLKQMLKEASSIDAPPREIVERVERYLSEVRARRRSEHIQTVRESQEEFMRFLKVHQGKLEEGGAMVGMPPAFPTIVDMVPTLFEGNMVLLTARTKVGKSTFAQQWMDSMLKAGLRGVYLHFEDSPVMMGLKRAAREMGWHSYDEEGNFIGFHFSKMLKEVLTDHEMGIVAKSMTDDEWTSRGTQIYCADWEMSEAMSTLRMIGLQQEIDFFIVDYLNKARVSSSDLRSLGLYEARARDAEMVKSTAERMGVIGILIQQEGKNGQPFQTMQGSQKSQVWLSLERHKLGEEEGRRLSNAGKVSVRFANLGETGDVSAVFNPHWLLWYEVDTKGDGDGKR